jgi:predicted O-methyltransferase YrrM
MQTSIPCCATENHINQIQLQETLAQMRSTSTYVDLNNIKKKISMLHTDVLTILYMLVRESQGAILEIGPYIGGSSIAISKGLESMGQGGKRKYLTIESGGKYLEHPDLPSNDIIGDLTCNLTKYGYRDWMQLIQGWSGEKHVMDALMSKLAGDSIGLLFIDADGNVDRDFKLYLPLCSDNCYLVIDDYTGPETLKALPTKICIDGLVADGVLEAFGIYGWGTWIGRLMKRKE